MGVKITMHVMVMRLVRHSAMIEDVLLDVFFMIIKHLGKFMVV